VSDFHAFEVAAWSQPGRAERYESLVARVTAHAVEPLLDAAGVHAGTRVLDVACGTGFLVATAESREADAIGVDISPDMVRFARSRHPHLRFEAADAGALPFGDDSFDAALAAFLLHHVPDPQRIVSELARVARRVALAQWDTGDRARLLGIFSEAIRDSGVESHGPTGPARELLASRAELERLLLGAGLEGVRVDTIDFVQRAQDVEEFWSGVLAASVNTAATVDAQDDTVRRRIRGRVGELAAAYERDGALEIPVSVKIASGNR
jgi:SAM-dependent methyltransferase